MRTTPVSLGCAALLSLATWARADAPPDPALQSRKDRWVAETLLRVDHPVISFIYDGVPSTQLLAGWTKSPVETAALADGRTRRTLRWTDPRTHLEVRVESVDYPDYPAVEWIGYIKNAGTSPSPLLETVRALDVDFPVPATTQLRTTQGDNFSAASYEPLVYTLTEEARSFQPEGGRPTNGAWPYFNLDAGGQGVLIALGWPGQWQAKFSRANGAAHVVGGQETTHFRLQPGEEIRTPLVALDFWKGADWIAGQNQWRHWFLAHNIPRPGGQLPPTGSMICPPELFTSAKGVIAFSDNYIKHGFHFDYLWVDAGWYPTDHDWFSAKGVGSWKPDPGRYPHGISEVSDYAHQQGMKFVLWFEPERVYRDSDLWKDHPDWLLHWDEGDKGHQDLRLLNLGNPAALQWLISYISKFVGDNHIDIYRQDFNVDPLRAWQNNDAPDRQGLTENHYVQGYLAYWDGLLRDHPGLMIDSCASGGRRNDLETLRRGVPLLRSDYQAPGLTETGARMTTDVFDGNQGHSYGLNLWVPFYGTGEYADDIYSERSHQCPWLGMGTHADHPDWAALKTEVSDHLALAKYFYGDYYPLLPYTKSEHDWIAWEFYRPGDSDGSIQAFRREHNPATTTHLKLQALTPEAQYEFTNIDTGATTRASGRELMDQGLTVYAAAPRSALIFTFKKIQ